MEDALVLKLKVYHEPKLTGLNPCFNGRCTRTIYWFMEKKEFIKS